MKLIALFMLIPIAASATGWDAERAQTHLLTCSGPGIACAVEGDARCVASGGEDCTRFNADVAETAMRVAYADFLAVSERETVSEGMAANSTIAQIAHGQDVWVAERDRRCSEDPLCLTGYNIERAGFFRDQIQAR
ncbi:hypothetical protein [Pontivivens insulae]|uniref:Lysozyme inhibitor LprI N-terminal domain-containing protein n=1 Tax=Pontivivens insulae TaxID=1639689 RepID=A0A2R8AEI4_9RHOB|nr:hypothetical protein [Pontivivens insulae]RED11882.1 hypothetical protein DFR53_2593 [Pontivivens insulae]SPF30639.1 hypothetical protein POI8812_02979 [Pontivivens insulae]